MQARLRASVGLGDAAKAARGAWLRVFAERSQLCPALKELGRRAQASRRQPRSLALALANRRQRDNVVSRFMPDGLALA